MNSVCKLALIGCVALTYGAGAVELIADDRLVEEFSSNGNSEDRPSADFANFGVNGQNSQVSAESFVAFGSGSGYSDFDFYIRQSYFDITFSAAEGETIELTGNGTAFDGDFGLATVRVRLFSGAAIDDAQLIYGDSVESDFGGKQVGDFEYNAALAAGTYRLVLQTDITPGGFDTYGNFTIGVTFGVEPPVDSDSDGVLDQQDNCLFIANASQFDGDGDGYGNACDADFTNDCVVNASDLGLLRINFFTDDPATDITEDGVVNVADLGALRALFFMAPGPSALTDTCTPVVN